MHHLLYNQHYLQIKGMLLLFRCFVQLFCHTMDYIAHQASLCMGIIQARILEWVAISFPRDRTCVSCIGRQILYHWATREAQIKGYQYFKSKLTEDAHNPWKQHIFVCFHPSSHLYLFIFLLNIEAFSICIVLLAFDVISKIYFSLKLLFLITT